jgi:hypothetical protein
MTPDIYRRKGRIDFWYLKDKLALWSTAVIIKIIRNEWCIWNVVY